MSLSEQLQRVDGGQIAALKALIEKYGGTVPEGTKIDGYANIINSLGIYSQQEMLSDTTKTALGLTSSAVPDDAFQKTISPPGTILWYGAAVAPAGYLLCDGSAVSRVDYAALFAVIGTAFGAGDGSTTFALPDMRAAFVRGAGVQSGYSATFGTKQQATRVVSSDSGSRAVFGSSVSNGEKSSSYSGYIGGTQSSLEDGGKYYAVRPYNIALTPIIKY